MFAFDVMLLGPKIILMIDLPSMVLPLPLLIPKDP
jgi:hypothetical protein